MNDNSYSSDGISINTVETVFDLLSLIEKRPEALLGGVTNSASYAALVGYLNALEYSHFFDAGDHSLKDFKEWGHKKYLGNSTDDFYGWLDNEHGHEQAFREFFRELDEFKFEKGL